MFFEMFLPILTYGHEPWVMTKRVPSQVEVSEMSLALSLIRKIRAKNI